LLTEGASIIYVGQGPTVHDIRFLSALNSRWPTQELFFPYEEKQFRDIAKAAKPKVIIAGPLNQVISSIPSDIQLPIIGVSHAFDVNYPQDNINIRSNLQRCSMIITDCKTIHTKIVNQYLYAGPTEIIPYGCDYSFFSRIKLTLEKKLKILVTRNWTKVHNNILILEALDLLSDKGVDFHCSFVGDGPILEEGKEFAKKNLLDNQYTFFGKQNQAEIAALMEQNWVYISASKSDGSSVSLLESMSAGMICLVSSFPSNMEWISHKETGFIFENCDASDLANQLINISELSKPLLTKISRQGKKRVSVEGNWESNKELFLKSVAPYLKEEEN
jgi:glycosyltransferase involved in cell wall biosynthesis